MAFLVTLALGASIIYLLAELYKRVFLDWADSDAVATELGAPFINHPDLKRVDRGWEVDLEAIRRTGKKNIRWVTPWKPWERIFTISDPAMLKDIFAGTNWESYDRGAPFGDPHDAYAGGLVFQRNGPEWRQARAMFDRTFTTPAVRSYVPILNHLRDVFMEQLEKTAKESGDKGFDIQPLLSRFTFDTICRLAFGEDVHAQTTKEGERLLSAWENWFFASNLLSLLNIFLFNGAWKIFGGPLLKHWNAGKATIYGLIDRGLERRKRGEDLNRVSIMDDTLRSAKLPEFMKDDETFRKHLATLLFAGHDTTSGTCTIALHFLAHEPVWQARIRKELAELPEGPFSLEPLEGLPVLNAVIKETLRVYPAAPNGGGRYMLKDFTASYVDPVDKREKKIYFKKGDVVLPFVMGAQRHPDNWAGKDPDVWDPQRWLDDPNGGAKDWWAFNPFGNGARRCIGERLALGELRLILASMLRKYDVEPGEYEFVAKVDATMSAKYGVWIKLKEIAA